jgi:hypothetical protein
MGLSLRYKTSISSIKLLNDLPTENINALKELKIPLKSVSMAEKVDSGESKRALIRLFRVTHNLGEEESVYYLSSVDWDLTSAEALLKSELAFEARALSTPSLVSDSLASIFGKSTSSTSSSSEKQTTAFSADAFESEPAGSEDSPLIRASDVKTKDDAAGALRRRKPSSVIPDGL